MRPSFVSLGGISSAPSRTARLASFATKARIEAAASMKPRLPIIQTATASTGGSSFSPLATMSSIPSGNCR
jgi:hypothetical protein